MKNRIKSYETIIKNQHGNIVGVIGVIGLLLGALAINVSDSVQLDQKIQKYIGQKSAEDLFREEIETVFNTREGCSLTLSGMNSDGSDTIQIIRGPFGEPIIDLTSTTKDGKVIGSVGNAPLSILGIDLINQVETTPATNTVDPITGNQEANFERVIRASIRIRYAKGQWYDTDGNLIPQNALEQTAKSGLEAKKSIGNSNLALQIPLTIRHNSDATGSNGSIISCASLDHDNQQVRNRDLTAMELVSHNTAVTYLEVMQKLMVFAAVFKLVTMKTTQQTTTP